ncbi:MAG: hypothetical protein JWQ40_3402 [Segetibacter sp.]|nr:hypothetical protein [Segetibacter sp.]
MEGYKRVSASQTIITELICNATPKRPEKILQAGRRWN